MDLNNGSSAAYIDLEIDLMDGPSDSDDQPVFKRPRRASETPYPAIITANTPELTFDAHVKQ